MQETLNYCADKWVLSSAVQKLIRRGELSGATNAALRLEQSSPGYLKRRLPVIAMEEVGAADAQVCLQVMKTCSSVAYWRNPGETLGVLIWSLVTSPKSRTACDAGCLTFCDAAVIGARNTMRPLAFGELLAAAVDQEQETWTRIAALDLARIRLKLTGLAATETRDKVAIGFRLPPDQRALYVGHRSEVADMASMLPLTFEALSDAHILTDAAGLTGSAEVVRGVPLYALDMYSRTGRSAIGAFAKHTRALARHRFRASSRAAFTQAVSLAVFHLDSSALKGELVTSTSRWLRERIEVNEMASCGVCSEERPDFYAALAEDAEVLNECRAAALRGAE